MAEGSSSTAPAAAAPGRPWRRYGALAATAVLLALALQLVYGAWYLNYDARYALLWARDLLEGGTPEYLADFAPTPHPLQMAFGILTVPFGEMAATLMLWAVLLCFGAVVYVVYRLGSELFNPAVGIVTAIVVATRPALQRDAVLAYQDVPFALLVLTAVLLEARRPRRGTPILILLAAAGLLRPEGWALAGLYWLYLLRTSTNAERVRNALLVAAAPVIWAGTDWLVTGDPLHSLHGTKELAAAVDRRRHPSQVPYWTLQYFGYVLREPVVAALPLGLAFAWRHRRHRAALPIVVVGVMTLIFAIGPFFGLPLIGRYVRTPAMLLALFYGLAVAGWTMLPRDHPTRKRWMIGGGVAAALSVAFLPWHVKMLQGLETRVDRDSAFYEDLRDVGENPRVRRALAACAPLTTADHRPIPYIRWWIDGDPGSVGTVANRASPLGLIFLAPRNTRETRRHFRENFPEAKAPAAYDLLYRNASWRVDVAPECITRPPS